MDGILNSMGGRDMTEENWLDCKLWSKKLYLWAEDIYGYTEKFIENGPD